MYHLRVPREFARTGTWNRLDVVQSFQPMYVEMLFGQGLVVGGGVVAALVHWVLGLGAVAAAAAWGRRLGGDAVWAAVIFGATGLYVWESTSAFIDLGLALFSALAFWWSTETEGDWLPAILGGTFAGLAAGSKFTGLIVGLLAGIASVAVVWPDWRRGLRRLFVIGGLVVLIALPWYVRNALLTGNPIYPLANRLFGKPWVAFSTFTYGYGNDLLHLLSSPFDLLARGQAFDQGWSIGPALLALVPIGVSARRTRLTWILLVGLGLWWLVWYFSSPQTRLLLPVLPMAAGLASVGIRAIRDQGSRILRILAAVTIMITAGGGLATAALAVKMSAKVIVGRESEAEYLERNSWNYWAYEAVNRDVPGGRKGGLRRAGPQPLLLGSDHPISRQDRTIRGRPSRGRVYARVVDRVMSTWSGRRRPALPDGGDLPAAGLSPQRRRFRASLLSAVRVAWGWAVTVAAQAQRPIALAEPRLAPQRQIQPTRRAGEPATMACGGTSRVTTAPAAMNADSPIVTPQTIVAFAPMVAPWRTTVGSMLARRSTVARGLRTFVNTAEGPTNTSASRATPS